MNCYHWFTHFGRWDLCRLPFRVLNQLSGSAGCLRLFTHDSWWFLTQPPTPTLPPILPKKCFLEEHMERRGEKREGETHAGVS